MNETLAEVLRWAIPAAVVFGITALAILGGVVAIRAVRRSPRAQASAEAERTRAGSALVALDAAVEELDLELGLSGALYDGTAPPALRRARTTADRVLEESFESYVELGPAVHPAENRRVAARIAARAEEALAVIERARGEHSAWVQANVSAADQVAAARRRWQDLREQYRDPDALVRELSEQFDVSEWEQARRSAPLVTAELSEADRFLTAAERAVDNPTTSALPLLAQSERALRRAQAAASALEENHRLVQEAARAVAVEADAARTALRQAAGVRDGLDDPADADRLGRELRTIEAALTLQEQAAPSTPTGATREIARLRDRLDLALGDARTAQHRIRSARSALTGAIAAARSSIAHAEAKTTNGGADARARLAAAHRELAAAQQTSDDPVGALDAARRASRHAEDASALADYARLQRDGHL